MTDVQFIRVVRGHSACRTHRHHHSGSVDVEDTRSIPYVTITNAISRIPCESNAASAEFCPDR